MYILQVSTQYIPFPWPLCLRTNKCLCTCIHESQITLNYIARATCILRDEQLLGVIHLFLWLLSYYYFSYIFFTPTSE